MTLEDVFSDAGLIIYIPYRWKRKPELILVGQIIGREKILVTTKKLVTFRRLFFTDKVNYLPQALNKTGSYLYTDATCICYQDKDVGQLKTS